MGVAINFTSVITAVSRQDAVKAEKIYGKKGRDADYTPQGRAMTEARNGVELTTGKAPILATFGQFWPIEYTRVPIPRRALVGFPQDAACATMSLHQDELLYIHDKHNDTGAILQYPHYSVKIKNHAIIIITYSCINVQ